LFELNVGVAEDGVEAGEEDVVEDGVLALCWRVHGSPTAPTTGCSPATKPSSCLTLFGAFTVVPPLAFVIAGGSVSSSALEEGEEVVVDRNEHGKAVASSFVCCAAKYV
jgi:hypothetical protein